jgi:hypothetical protein
MVTKGYRKGVYERVTKGTGPVQCSAGTLPAVFALGSGAVKVLRGLHASSMNTLFGASGAPVYF